MKTTSAIILALGAFFISGCASQGIKTSKENVRNRLLELTPVGSSPQEVLNFIAAKDFTPTSYNKNEGFEERGVGYSKVIGTSYISATLGDYYWFPKSRIYMNSYWIFDLEQRLSEIKVFRDIEVYRIID